MFLDRGGVVWQTFEGDFLGLRELLGLRLPDGSVFEVEEGTTGLEAARRISEALARGAVAVSLSGRLLDMRFPLMEGGDFRVITERDGEALEVLRHSAAHIMADAVMRFFGGETVALGIGPAIEDGFYYDFDLPRPLSADDLHKIEELMRQIVEEDHEFSVQFLKKEEARRLFESLGQRYKLELLDEIEDEEVSVFRHGDFVDLCRGPHVRRTGQVKHFRLLSLAGAYWRGDERNPMLTRIYGTAFFKKRELEAHLSRLEEAKKRDHRLLGRELDFYSVRAEFGPGLVLWHPKAARVRQIIERFWIDEHYRRGYQLVYTPHIASERIYEISGHLEKYTEYMFAPMEIEGQKYRIKPMNCPGHIMIYKSRQRSYRDLPIRYAELGTVYRYERSGVLHGLLRVRGFTQDDAHIFCTPEQLEEEILGVLDLADFMMRTFGFKYRVFLATRPEKYIGDERRWEEATEALRRALKRRGLAFDIDPGGGVYYGPKIDIHMEDALGRLWQGPTIQVDFNLAERFDITYIGPDGQRHRVVMVHRTVLGSMERFLGVLLEHYGGLFPLWLAPEQARVLPVTDEVSGYAEKVAKVMREAGLRVEVDLRRESLQAKIRDAELEKIPYMVIVGKKEAEKERVSLRKKGAGIIGQVSLEEAINRLREEASPPKID